MKNNRIPGLKQVKIVFIFVLLITTLSMNIGLFLNLKNMGTNIISDIDNSSDVSNAVIHLRSAFGYTGFIHNFKNYVLRGTPKYYDNIKKYYDEIEMSINHMNESPFITEDAQKLLNIIMETADAYMDASKLIKPMVERGDPVTTIDAVVKINDTPAREALDALAANYNKMIIASTNDITSQMQRTFIIVFLLITGSITVIIALLMFNYKRLVKQVKKISEVSRVMADGDLTKEITTIPDDAIGDMAENFNNSISSLKNIISGITSTSQIGNELNTSLSEKIDNIEKSSAKLSESYSIIRNKVQDQNLQIVEVSTALEEISANTSNLSKQIHVQAEQVSTTSAAVEQITASIMNVARVAGNKKDISESLITITRKGGENIGDANANVQEAVKSMGAMQDMVEVINNITSQTNLLSMNAAIEAAHAGDAGKGFAVVADEIRKLAESTAKNAQEIAKSLTNLIERINKTAEVTVASGESFSKIESEVRNFVEAFSEISASTFELSNGSKEIQDSTALLLDITTNIKIGSEEISLGAESINTSLLAIKDASEENTRGLSESFSKIEEIHKSLNTTVALSSENTENMNTLLQTVSIFKI